MEPTMHGRKRLPVSAAALAGIAALLASGAASAQPSDSEEIEVIGELMWALKTNGESVPWSDANAFCETLEHAGHDDWRLPALAELESLYDPGADARGRIRSPFELEDCCAWSRTDLNELEPESKGVLPEPTNDPGEYYWGFLFPSGVRYYSFERFPDGLALCVRDNGEG
jgi:hypothetical protein